LLFYLIFIAKQQNIITIHKTLIFTTPLCVLGGLFYTQIISSDICQFQMKILIILDTYQYI